MNINQITQPKNYYKNIKPISQPINYAKEIIYYDKNKRLFPDLEQMAITNMPAVKINTGKHKIPRYLYHFTNADSLEQIKKTGQIAQGGKGDIPGVYMVDMNNFLKYWKKPSKNNPYCQYSLLAKLLRFSQHRKSKSVTCIKIPSEKLDLKLMQIRSQKRMQAGDYLPDGINNVQLYNQKKEPIEYIYSGDIPLSECEIIGPVKTGYFVSTDGSYNEQHLNALNILEKLFKDKPEKQGIAAQIKNIV